MMKTKQKNLPHFVKRYNILTITKKGRPSNQLKNFNMMIYEIQCGKKKLNKTCSFLKRNSKIMDNIIVFTKAVPKKFPNASNDLKILFETYCIETLNLNNLSEFRTKLPDNLEFPTKTCINNYPFKQKINDPNKINVNNELINLIRKNYKNKYDELKAIVFDDIHMVTSKILSNIGIQTTNIYIPNYDTESCQQMIPQNNGLIFNCFFSNFMKQVSKVLHNSIDICWLDYCCTFSGNKIIQPKNDIDIFFKLNFLKKNGIFGITFSHRDPNYNKNQVNHFVHQIALNYGYLLEKQNIFNYKSVYTIFFTSKKIN